MSKHVIDDAKRCLQCPRPRCSVGCPVNTPIKEAIKLLLENDIAKAGEMIFKNNPLSLVCSQVCPQENQCEGHCVLGIKSSPVQISAIEQYISDFYLNIYKPEKSTGISGKIAIIGSGPAGITAAYYLASKNYNVIIFEGNDRIGGVLRYGIPEFRLPKTILDRHMTKLKDLGVKIRPNTILGANLTIAELFRDGYEAVLIASGVWRPLKLGVKGESLGHVHFAIEYLRNSDSYELGNTVAIVGAGNVAMDVARTAIRKGAKKVVIFCHKDESGITAREVEVVYAKIDGADFEFNKAIVEFTDEGVILCDTISSADDNGGKITKTVKNSEHLFTCDSVIIAISQGPRSIIVSSTPEIKVNDKGLVITDENGQTTYPGVFAAGDVVTGGKTVVEAVKNAKLVANAIDEYLINKKDIKND